MSVTDLNKELGSQKESLRKFGFGVTGSKVKNVKEGRDTKRNIARILTEISSRSTSDVK